MNKLFLSGWLAFNVSLLNAQDIDLAEELAEQLTDEIQQSEEEPIDQYFWENLKVVNINKSSYQELRSIPWLTMGQIQNLLKYIEQNGPLVSVYELQAVPEWDLATIRMTLPLIKINRTAENYDGRSLSEQLTYDGGVEIFIRTRRRLQLSNGYAKSDNSGFEGAPLYWFAGLRYRKKGSMDFGFRAEKDAGERFKWDPKTNRYGVDHISMFLSLENKGPFKKITVGDFTVQWDQGLIMGGGLSFRKQAVIGPRKVHSGIVPHTGSGEYGYHQGVGAELEFRGTAVSAFYSRRLLDTQIQTQDTVNHLPSIITSIIQTGLHRTPAELKNRKKVSQQVIGVHIKKTWSPNLAISVSGLYRILGKPMIPDSKRYNQHTFSGNRNLNLSTGFEYLWNNLNLYGQFAVSSSRGWGTLVGLTASLYHNLSMTLHFRNYTKDFHGISGRAFGINSQNTNEQGIYWAFQYSPHPKWTAGFYTDIYKTLSPTFISDAGYSGIDKLFRLQLFPHKRGLIDIYYRGTNRAVNSKPLSGKSTHDQIDATKHMAGLRAKWQGEKNISLQCRLQYSRYHVSESITHGGIVSNQVSYTLDFLKITANMTLFDTDNFENRQYIYEKDLPNSLSVPFFHGVGTRWFVMLQLKVVENLGFWLKFGESNYFDRNQLGAGPDRIENSKRSDLSLQIRYKL